MELPIYIEGETAGTLTVRRRKDGGLCLDARVADRGRVLRLRVFGERELYLGVPVPEEGGGLRLTRRLTPAEARRFPRQAAWAGEKPGDRPAPAAEEAPAPPERRVLWLGGRPHYF